jgi:hypothetical protein
MQRFGKPYPGYALIPVQLTCVKNAVERNLEVEPAIPHRLQARGISHVISDTKCLLRLSLLRSGDNGLRGIHARDAGSPPGELTGERAVATADIEYVLAVKWTQHPEEGRM